MNNPYDSFQKLEEKVLQVAEALKRSQEEKRALEQELKRWKTGSNDQTKRLESLEKELQTLRQEREDVRARVEKIIKQIDVLTTPEAGG